MVFKILDFRQQNTVTTERQEMNGVRLITALLYLQKFQITKQRGRNQVEFSWLSKLGRRRQLELLEESTEEKKDTQRKNPGYLQRVPPSIQLFPTVHCMNAGKLHLTRKITIQRIGGNSSCTWIQLPRLVLPFCLDHPLIFLPGTIFLIPEGVYVTFLVVRVCRWWIILAFVGLKRTLFCLHFEYWV